MTNKEATTLLNSQRNSLYGLTTGNLSLFVNNTKLIIDMIFQEGSNERAFFDNVNIEHINSGSTATQDNQVHMLRLQFADFFNKCIEAVNKRKEPKLIKDNVLSHKNNWELVFHIAAKIVLPIIVFTFGVGYYFGAQKQDRENSALRMENQQFHNSNVSLIESVKKLTNNR